MFCTSKTRNSSQTARKTESKHRATGVARIARSVGSHADVVGCAERTVPIAAEIRRTIALKTARAAKITDACFAVFQTSGNDQSTSNQKTKTADLARRDTLNRDSTRLYRNAGNVRRYPWDKPCRFLAHLCNSSRHRDCTANNGLGRNEIGCSCSTLRSTGTSLEINHTQPAPSVSSV